MADVPEPIEYRMDEAALRMVATDEPTCGFEEMLRLLAREVIAWRRGAAERAPDLEAARIALEQLSGRMMGAGDERRFGVNAAARVLEAVQRASDVDGAIAQILGQSGDPGEDRIAVLRDDGSTLSLSRDEAARAHVAYLNRPKARRS